MKKSLLFALSLSALIYVKAQDGTLDNSFGTSGTVTTDINANDDSARNITIQSDGKIIVGGYTDNGSDEDFLLVRYNVDGTLDNTFGANGVVITNVSSGNDVIRGLALQSDGKIIAVGYAGVTNEFLSIVRYNTDGTLDNSFGNNGMDSLLIYNNSGSNRTVPNDVKIQPDGKIIVAGFTKNSGGYLNSMLVRYNSNGTLDNTFGISGAIVTPFGNTDSEWEQVAIQTDGNIVTCGYYVTGPNTTMSLARYNSIGLDNIFGSNGIVTMAIASGENKFTSLMLQADGKIVVGGHAPNTNGNTDFAVLRYIGDGTLDNTFGTSGVTTTELGSNVDDYLTQLTIQPDGKIVACGAVISTANDLSMVRYNTDGSIDNSFGSGLNGIVSSNFTTTDDVAFGIALQDDGKILLAGGSDGDVFVNRYSNTLVGLHENIDLNNQLKIYPNPATHKIFIDYDNMESIQKICVRNILGSVIIDKTIRNNREINISTLKRGQYIIEIITHEGITTKKFMKN